MAEEKGEGAFGDSNLVIQTTEVSHRDSGPTGEVEPLTDKFSSATLRTHFGSRAHFGKPTLLKEQHAQKRKRDTDGLEPRTKKARRVGRRDTVVEAEIQRGYKPKTADTKRAYTVLMTMVERYLSGHAHDVIQDAANDVIGIMKDDRSVPKKKLVRMGRVLGRKISETEQNKFHNTVGRITDYYEQLEQKGDQLADKNVPVQWDAADEVQTVGEVIEEASSSSEDEQAEDITQAHRKTAKAQTGETLGKAHEDFTEKAYEIDPKEVDAYWLQKKLNEKTQLDAHKAKEMADEILNVLEIEDINEAENELVELMGTQHFEFGKKLLRNRDIIVWCTRLARKGTNMDERENIKQQMRSDPALYKILQTLEKTVGKASEKSKKQLEGLVKDLNEIQKKAQGTMRNPEIVVNLNADLSADAQWHKARSKQQLDLDSLSFRQEGHFQSNQDWHLRQGSRYLNKKGYQEILVESYKAQPPKMDLIKLEEMPEWARPAFKTKGEDDERAVQALNAVQTTCYPCAFKSAENMLLCAPTGAGKTNVAMLAILREIGVHRLDDGTIDKDKFKIVYIAPMKSLVREVVMKFTKRLKPYDLTVAELSGDVQFSKEQFAETQVLVSTPEKWDIITRKGMERRYTQLVKLIIIDEVHLLHDTRGTVLECIVARTLRQIEASQELIRIVALSATLPNYTDIATFLKIDPDKGLFYFDQGYRPCPLEQRFAGISLKKPLKRRDLENELCYKYVMEQVSDGQQVIVFVHSRKQTGEVAKWLRDKARDDGKLAAVLPEDTASFMILKEEVEHAKDRYLKELLPNGFALHHAGMTRSDRSQVEDLFRDEHCKVLVSTATLAWGVNLPAHAVIIKGTQVYNPEKGRFTELSMLDVLQMFGRAGRPDFDKFGQAYMITSHSELKYYMPLLNDQLPIESQLISKLPDALNAEIVLGTIHNLREAVHWMAYTYLFVRMAQAPDVYQVPKNEKDPTLEQRRIDLAHTAAMALDKANLVKYDRTSGNFQVTDLGRIAAHYYVGYQSMQTYVEFLQPTMSDIEIFRVFSLSGEFSSMSVRENEKEELAGLLDRVPIPIKEGIEEGPCKINVLLQAYISRLKLDGFALVSDMVYVTQSAGRLMRALYEIVLKKGWAAASHRILSLCKMIQHRMWSIESPLRQFPKTLPKTCIKRMEQQNFPFEHYAHLKESEIGELIRFPKLARRVHKLVHKIPRLSLQCQIQPITRTIVKVELEIAAEFRWDDNHHGTSEEFWVIVENVDGETILHHEYFILKKKFHDEPQILTFTIPIYDPLPPQYFIRVVSNNWLGSESVLPISFRNLILPQKNLPTTELLDLQPQSVSAIKNTLVEQIYRKEKIESFNAIQTQVFNTLFNTDENVLLCAPTGSGKTVCAEICILRMLEELPNGRCVYVAPKEEIAQLTFNRWRYFFMEQMRERVFMLTGDQSKDLKYIQSARIVISTAEHWDMMSRRWRKRKAVQNVNLLIIDELHLVVNEGGPTLEIIISRMRYMANQTGNQMRIIGLSASVSNAPDLGTWIGAPQKTTFNFHPRNRPVNLQINFHGSDIADFEARHQSYAKPVYLYINRFSPRKKVIVFAPSRSITRRLASSILAFAAAEDKPRRFLKVKYEEFLPYAKKIEGQGLQNCLLHGVAYIHEHTTKRERNILEKIWTTGAIQVMVVEHSLAWGLDMSAYMVVVCGTRYYDGGTHSYVDYRVPDLLQMIGRANRPKTNDRNAHAVVVCPSSKKSFYSHFLTEPFPVESHLHLSLADHINAEIVSKTIENASDAIDMLTWTFYMHRLTLNPNYYGMTGKSHQDQSKHLSELIENVFEDLAAARCIAVDQQDMDVQALNNGLIACYYYIKYQTIETFGETLKPKRTMRGILEVLSSAVEFQEIPVRRNEDRALEKIARHCALKIASTKFTDPGTKVNILLQTHFSRRKLGPDVQADRRRVLAKAIPLLWSMIDVLSTNMWLKPALTAMELCQMITQGLWDTDSVFMQLPFITAKDCEKFKEKECEGIFDFVELEDEDRDQLIGHLSERQKHAIAEVCNTYPNVDVNYQIEDESEITTRSTVCLTVQVEREALADDDEEEPDPHKPIPIPMVHCPLYPKEKVETWFLVVGDQKNNKLHRVKRFNMQRLITQFKLTFEAPSTPGDYSYQLFLMSDSYIGCDQEFQIEFNVKEGEAMEDDSDSE